MRASSRWLGMWLGVGLALAAGPARAALGDDEASVSRDGRALVARWQGATERGSYRVHELLKGGTTIREFVSRDGVVFAVAWSGLANPELDALLGTYAGEYQAAAQTTPKVNGRRGGRVAADHVVVDRWGHMRDLHGRAYLPDLLPAGVTVDELR
jgi:hypothetical protein